MKSRFLIHPKVAKAAVFLALLALGHPSAPVLAKGDATVSAKVLMQKQDLYGSVKVILAAQAIRIEAPDRSNLLISKGPVWKVEVYNTKTKRAMQMDFNEYICHPIQATYFNDPANQIAPITQWQEMVKGWRAWYVPAGEIDLLGRPCEAYWNVAPQNRKRVDVYYFATCDVLKDSPADSKAVLILQKFLFSETGLGIPIRIRKRQSEKTKERYGTLAGIGDYMSLQSGLSTTSITDTAVPLSSFEYLKGYARVNREIDLLDDGKPKASLEELFGGADVRKNVPSSSSNSKSSSTAPSKTRSK